MKTSKISVNHLTIGEMKPLAQWFSENRMPVIIQFDDYRKPFRFYGEIDFNYRECRLGDIFEIVHLIVREQDHALSILRTQ